MTATTSKPGPEADVEDALVRIALFADAGLHRTAHTFDPLAKNEVDDARNRVGTISRRRTARHHFDALDQIDRNQRGVDGAASEAVAISSEARRVGKACVSTCRSRGSPDH